MGQCTVAAIFGLVHAQPRQLAAARRSQEPPRAAVADGSHSKSSAALRSSDSPYHSGVAVWGPMLMPAAASRASVGASGAPSQLDPGGTAGNGSPSGRRNRNCPSASPGTTRRGCPDRARRPAHFRPPARARRPAAAQSWTRRPPRSPAPAPTPPPPRAVRPLPPPASAARASLSCRPRPPACSTPGSPVAPARHPPAHRDPPAATPVPAAPRARPWRPKPPPAAAPRWQGWPLGSGRAPSSRTTVHAPSPRRCG